MDDHVAETVIVEWTIKAGRDAEFFAFRRPVAESTPGFLGETLYRADVDGEPDANLYINIGRWRSREEFYDALPTAIRDVAPKTEPFEAAPRRRLWLRPSV